MASLQNFFEIPPSYMSGSEWFSAMPARAGAAVDAASPTAVSAARRMCLVVFMMGCLPEPAACCRPFEWDVIRGPPCLSWPGRSRLTVVSRLLLNVSAGPYGLLFVVLSPAKTQTIEEGQLVLYALLRISGFTAKPALGRFFLCRPNASGSKMQAWLVMKRSTARGWNLLEKSFNSRPDCPHDTRSNS